MRSAREETETARREVTCSLHISSLVLALCMVSHVLESVCPPTCSKPYTLVACLSQGIELRAQISSLERQVEKMALAAGGAEMQDQAGTLGAIGAMEEKMRGLSKQLQMESETAEGMKQELERAVFKVECVQKELGKEKEISAEMQEHVNDVMSKVSSHPS